MKKENMNLLDGMNYQEDYNMSPLEVRKTVRHHGSRRRLVLLIILLICTLSLLGSATYAWFTANKLVRVEDMQISVNVANGIEISSDAYDWKQAVTLDDLYMAAGLTLEGSRTSNSEDAGAVNQFPAQLHNISSIGNVSKYHRDTAENNNNRLELYTGTASSVCDVPDLANPGSTKTVGISNSEGFAGDFVDKNGNGVKDPDENDHYSLEDCVIGQYCLDTDGDGTPECDGATHSVTTGLVDSHPYNEKRKSCYGTSEGEGCDADVDVIAFDLYLKLDEPSNIKLAEGSSVTRIGEDNLGLENTIRVAFVTLGTQPSDFYYADDKVIQADGKGKTCAVAGDTDCIDTKSSSDVAKANGAYETAFGGFVGKYGARTMNAFGSITIWEPNHNQHTKAAIENAEKNYKLTGITQTSDYITQGIYGDMSDRTAGYLPLPLDGAKKDVNPDRFAPQQKVEKVDGANKAFDASGTNRPYKNEIGYIKSAGKLEGSGSQYLFSAPAGVTKVRVYIWVEGNDIDTENNATASKVNVSLLFTSAISGSEKAPTFAGDAGNNIYKYVSYSADNQIPISNSSITWRETPPLGEHVQETGAPKTT